MSKILGSQVGVLTIHTGWSARQNDALGPKGLKHFRRGIRSKQMLKAPASRTRRAIISWTNCDPKSRIGTTSTPAGTRGMFVESDTGTPWNRSSWKTAQDTLERMKTRLALARCQNLPEWEVDDQPLHTALRRLGIHLETPNWEENANWSSYDLVVPRLTWNYQEHPDAFAQVDRCPRTRRQPVQSRLDAALEHAQKIFT